MDKTAYREHGAGFKQECPCVLGIATVPIQQWGQIYDPTMALKRGTIFADLDLPFFGGGDLLG